MSFVVHVLPRAHDDVLKIATWIADRSPQGADSWLAAYEQILERLAYYPLAYGPAFEAKSLKRDLRQAFFRTRQGNRYRLVFLVDGDSVTVLRVRGQGEIELAEDDL